LFSYTLVQEKTTAGTSAVAAGLAGEVAAASEKTQASQKNYQKNLALRDGGGNGSKGFVPAAPGAKRHRKAPKGLGLTGTDSSDTSDRSESEEDTRLYGKKAAAVVAANKAARETTAAKSSAGKPKEASKAPAKSPKKTKLPKNAREKAPTAEEKASALEDEIKQHGVHLYDEGHSVVIKVMLVEKTPGSPGPRIPKTAPRWSEFRNF
jgi:hypothetical protein